MTTETTMTIGRPPAGIARRMMRMALAAGCAGMLLETAVAPVRAQPAPAGPAAASMAHAFDIPAQPLSDALTQFGRQSGLQISVSAALVQGRTTPGVSGTLVPTEALRRLLAGTGLTATIRDGDIVTLAGPPGPESTTNGGVIDLPRIMVAGQPGQTLPPVYAGGQVARGADVGLLGERDYMETPFSISGYTSATVRDQQARSVAEVLSNNDPSVRAAIGIANRYDALTIRGFRVDTGDMAINGLYGLVPEFRVNPAPAERIELLKGPAAFLFGMAPQGGIGGTVNIVTKRADDEPLSRATAEYFSNTVFSGLADVGRRYGDHKEYGVRINGTFTGGNTPIDRQWIRNGSLAAGFDYRGDNLRLYADVLYQNDYMSGSARGYAPAPGIQMPMAPNARINLAQPYDYARSRSVTGIVRAEYDISPDTTAFGAFGANFFDYDKREAPGATILDYTGAAASTSTFQTGQSRNLSGEAGVRTRFDTGPIRHEVAVSANLLQQTYWLGQTAYQGYATNIYAPSLGVGLTQVSSFPQSLSATNLLQSVAVADTLTAADGRLQLLVGLRNQQISSANYAPTTGAITFNATSSAVTPSVAVLVRPIKELSFYASYIQGLSPSGAPPAGAANANQLFPPFRTTQYEAGIKLDLGTFGATLAGYLINLPNGLIDPFTNVYAIDGEQQNRGIEFNVFGQPLPDLRILGGIALLDARQTRTAGGQYDGNVAVGAPALQTNLGVEWDLPFARGLTAIARSVYTSEAYVSADNVAKVPAWTTLDLGLRYRTTIARTPVVLRANLTNLLDTNYWIANPTGYVISGMPRMAWISLQADF